MTSTSGLVQSGTKTFVVGTVSGIDTSQLVEIGVQQRTRKADIIDVNVSTNNAKVAAYTELQTLSKSIENSLEKLRNQSIGGVDGSNVFDTRAGFISTSDGSNPAGVLDVTVDDGAPLGTYQVEIIQQATVHKVAGDTVADSTAALGYTGTFGLRQDGDGVAAQIAVTAGMSLEDIADAINAESGDTLVSASILKVSETESQLILTATDTAKTINTSYVSGSLVLNQLGVITPGGAINNELSPAQQAIIELDGVTISRDDNTFDDLITGITLDVNGENAGTLYTLRVENDASAVRTAITDFVDAYNALRDFVIAQSTVSADGIVDESAVLFSDTLLENLDLTVSGLLSSSAGSSSLITSLRDLGIDLDVNNKLFVSDGTELDDAILNNFTDVQNLFASSFTDDSDEFTLLANNSTFGNSSFALDITVDGSGNITSAGIGGDTSLFTINGTLISGAAGTIYEGLQFAFAGTTSTTVNVSVAQGLADRLANTLEQYSSTGSDGIFQTEKVRLEAENTDLTAESARIREIAEEYREREIAKFGALEARLQANELLVKQIRALFGRDSDDN